MLEMLLKFRNEGLFDIVEDEQRRCWDHRGL